jgi:hypothetical protein
VRVSMVGLGRFELPTSRLSGVRSNQLSYRPDHAPPLSSPVARFEKAFSTHTPLGVRADLERETKTAAIRHFGRQ